MSDSEPAPSTDKGKYHVSLKTTLLLMGAMGVGGFSTGKAFKNEPIIDENFPKTASVAPLNWKTRFSPKGGCTRAIVEVIDKAKRSIFVQACFFNSDAIAQALIRAKNDRYRQVNVQIIIDKEIGTNPINKASDLHKAGIPIYLDGEHGINHNKVLIVDESTVVTGSFNFTDKAENSHAENLIIIEDPAVATEYQRDWEKHRRHSKPFDQAVIPPIIRALSPEEATKRMGDDCTYLVELRVGTVRRYDSWIFLNSLDYNASGNFAIKIESSAKPREYPDMDSYFWYLKREVEGKTVCVNGKVESYKGAPRITVRNRGQLSVQTAR